jgi:asparagine synthase (glutamine-hydrolysing)
MCGISLIINRKNGPVDLSLIRAMNQKVIHRGPDDEGFYQGGNFAFGHRRLSILDLSVAGRQPMVRGKNCINYNGEIYNYVELISELKRKGLQCLSQSDTEVLLLAYEAWGTDAFAKCNGMWAFMIHDAAKNEIIICRDRFGVKPIYYTLTDDYFLAASEIKQFTVVPGFKSRLNKEATMHFLTKGWLNYSDKTFFEGVMEIRPGHFLRYNLGTHEYTIQRWYALTPNNHDSSQTEKDAIDKVHGLLADSIHLRMRADVPVGSCLSGGIDSSSIVSFIHDHAMANGTFKTITSCYKDRDYDEQDFSDIVTRQVGFKAVKVFPDLDKLFDENHLDQMIYSHDQPFSGASHYSEYNVFKTARENGIIVLLDGQGSDEYFCGYDEHFTVYLKSLLRKGKFRKTWLNLRYKSDLLQTGIWIQWKRFLFSAYGAPLIKVARKWIGRKEYDWLNPQWHRMAEKGAKDFDPQSIQELSLQELLYSSLPYQLHSADRNSMNFSLEVREPFMDYRLIEYVISLPDDYKINKGYSKHVLREAMTALPPEVKNRNHKMGFVAPDKPWILKNQQRIRKELEEAIQNTGIFSENLLHRFDLFTQNKLGFEPIYFRAMALNRFCKIFKMDLN